VHSKYLLTTNPHMKSSICVFYIQMHHGYYSLQLFMYFDSFLIWWKNPVHPKNNLMFNIMQLYTTFSWRMDKGCTNSKIPLQVYHNKRCAHFADYFAAFYKKRRQAESVPHIKMKTKLFQICSFPLNYLWKKACAQAQTDQRKCCEVHYAISSGV
jgi:hypothetical protein